VVSVIIPNYNHASFLERRIESVLNQTYQDFEIIILDDASTDESKKLIEGYRNHPKVSIVVFNENNSGSTFRQWQKGFELAKGEYIWIAESDDWCEPTLLSELLHPMIGDGNVMLSYCQSILVAAGSEKILDVTKADSLGTVVEGENFVREHLLVKNGILNASMVVFRKSAIFPMPEAILSMVYCGDWYLWAAICLKGKVFVSGKYLNYYSRHNNVTLTNASRKGYDFLEGNKVFKFIASKIDLTESERDACFEKKALGYYHLEPHFANQEVRHQVLLSMEQLGAGMTEILARKQNNTTKPGLIDRIISGIGQRIRAAIG